MNLTHVFSQGDNYTPSYILICTLNKCVVSGDKHEKYIYSILATENRKRKKTRSHPPLPILHPHTDTNNTVAHNTVGHQVPSLENWGGGLKSLLWHANSPHTPSVQTE